MKLLFVLFLVSLLYSKEVGLTFGESSVGQFSFHQERYVRQYELFRRPVMMAVLDHSGALLALQPTRKETFNIDYGKGVLSKKMEEITMVLLEYDWIVNVVTALTDDIKSNKPSRRFRVLVSTKKSELKFAYNF